jgi:hypothetical protein
LAEKLCCGLQSRVSWSVTSRSLLILYLKGTIMRDVNRIYDILVKFQDLWEQYPDQRFGQIISNYLVTDREDIFYIEDDEISQRLTDQLSVIEW